MKTILVLASHPELAEALRSSLDSARYRIVHRLNSDEAEPLLEHALVHVCIIDSEVAETQGTWLFEKIRRRLPTAPLLVYCDDAKWALEEEAYLAGVKLVLRKPVRARMLEAVLEQSSALPAVRPPSPPRAAVPAKSGELAVRPGSETTVRALQKWREFSSLLANSLSAEALLKQENVAPEIKMMAEKMRDDQMKEIAEMQKWLEAHPQ